MGEYDQGLVFVFDTTQSMSDDLEYFKSGSDIILNTIDSDPDMPITDYVLVPFNDPGNKIVSVLTIYSYFFKKHLYSFDRFWSSYGFEG